MLIGWDLSSTSCGWCAGTGERRPIAGAFQLVRRRRGEIGADLSRAVMLIHERFPAEAWCVEEPLMTPDDDVDKLVKLMGVNMLVYTLAEKLGVACHPVGQDQAKAEWGGRFKVPRGSQMTRRQRSLEGKKLMVAMCEKIGIPLPETQAAGKFDAADAVGIWKVGLRLTRSPHLQRWDMAVHGHRGALL